MTLQHAVFAAEALLAETTVAGDGLGSRFAGWVGAAGFAAHDYRGAGVISSFVRGVVVSVVGMPVLVVLVFRREVGVPGIVGTSVLVGSAGWFSVAVAVAVAGDDDDSDTSVSAVPPRRGERSSRVVAGCMLREEMVSDGGRWRPARRRRTSDGRLVEAERKSRTSDMELEGRTFRGIAVRLLV